MSNHTHERRFCLVVDGGGTKTSCCIGDDSPSEFHVLGRAETTGSNPAAIGVPAAVEAIRAAVEQARCAAAIGNLPIYRAAFSIAGTAEEHLRAELQAALQQAGFASQSRVFPDVLAVALTAGGTGEGVGLVAGTGSVAVAKNAAGQYALAGGWGYLLGDEGSGFAIGREAIRRTIAQLENRQRLSPLAERVLLTLEARSTDDLKRAVYRATQPRRTIASVAKAILEPTAPPDADVEEIVAAAADELVSLVLRACGRLDIDPAAARLAATGGVLAAGSPVRRAVEQRVADRLPSASIEFVDDNLRAARVLLRDDVFSAPVSILP